MTKQSRDQQRKARGLLILNTMLPPVLKPALSKRGLAEATILLDWAKIVGEEMASTSYPEKVSYPIGKKNKGTLLLNVDPSSILDFQYALDLILDRINAHYGYEAVSRIKLQQRPIDPFLSSSRLPSPKRAKLPLDEDLLNSIEDRDLQEALRKLALSLTPKDL